MIIEKKILILLKFLYQEFKNYTLLDKNFRIIEYNFDESKFRFLCPSGNVSWHSLFEFHVLMKIKFIKDYGQFSILTHINNIEIYFTYSVLHLDDYYLVYIKVSEDGIENKKDLALKDQLIDPVTGLMSRKALESTIKNWFLTKQHLAVCMTDIDNFKQINDRYGHTVGDKILKYFSNTLLRTIRSTDMCYRYGGEEFLVLMLDIDNLHMLEKVAKRIYEKNSNLLINHLDFSDRVTASFGFSLHRQNEDIWETIKRADDNLYFVKRNGKNNFKVS